MSISVRVPASMSYARVGEELVTYGGTLQVIESKLVFLSGDHMFRIELGKQAEIIADALKANVSVGQGLQPKSDAARAALAVEQSRQKKE